LNHLRRMTTMQEDFEALGLINPSRSNAGFPSEMTEDRSVRPFDFNDADTIDLDLNESDTSTLLEGIDEDLDDLFRESEETDNLDEDDDLSGILDEDADYSALDLTPDELSEALVRKRLKRQKAGVRAQARREYKKKRGSVLRKRKKREKKSSFKIRKKRITALRGTKSAGPRRRFSLENNEELLNTFESIDLKGNAHEGLIEGFMRIDEVATLLSRKFSVCDEIIDQLESELFGEEGIPVEHPDSEYDYENPDAPNYIAPGKTGDVTDTAKDAPKGNIASKDDHPQVKTPAGNVKFEMDGDSEDDDEDDDDDDMEESVDMPSEMIMLRMEAQDALAKLKTHVISPAEAGAILKDMVGYLGGAMKTYMDLAKDIGQYAYAGVDQPGEYTGGVNIDTAKHNYIGKDGLENEPASPAQYTQRT